jgi:exo-1,4-beta-D-glucosaminidase
MKKNCILFILLVAAAFACTRPAPLSCGDSLVLDKGWQLSRAGGAEQWNATVPSTVAGALYDAGFFGDGLLEGLAYAAADKAIFDDTWTYRTAFSAKAAPGQHYELCFDGLGYYADIFLNGTQIASSDTTFGVFRRRAYEVAPLLRSRNTLEVRLRRAQSGDLNIGFVDWNPRPLDESMGIVRPVTLHATGAVSIEDVFVIPDLDVQTLAQADLEVRVTLRNHEARPVEGTLHLDLQDAGQAAVPFSLEAGQTKTLCLTPAELPLLHLTDPRVWWSYDLGTPELYSLEARAEVAGVLSDRREVEFGVRQITSSLTADNYRQFKLNGRDILLKGAGWTDDIFLRDTQESLRRQVEYVKDMNLNCIRFENIWGKDDTVYDLCDRLGVLSLVGWSCQWEWENYCGLPETDSYGCINTPETEDLAVAYFRDQVVRLHNHASLIGWLTGSDRIPNPGLEQRYMEIYNAQEYRPYVCSAKNMESGITGWSGTKMEGPYEWVGADYWYRDTQAGGAFGFNTETGIGANLPQAGSLRRMIPEDALWPLSEAWDYHCTASTSAMNATKVLNAVIEGHYGAAIGFEDFVRKAHAVDYDGTRGMFEAFRVRMPRSTGIVQWMLNSAWPSLYWQLYDWYGVPTAGYYGTKKACEPLQLMFNYADRKVYAVSESPEPVTLKANYLVYDEQSRLLGGDSKDVRLGYRTSLPVFDLRRFDGRPHFVALSLTAADGTVVADNFYCLPAKDNEYVWDRTNWYITPVSRYADLRFAFGQEPADVQMSVEERGDGQWAVTLTNKSSVIAYMNILQALDAAGELVAPAFWSDNFFPLLPGQTKTVSCRADVRDIHFKLD